MAEQVTLNVNVETGSAVKNLGNLEKATQSVSKTTQQAAKNADSLESQFDQLNKEIKESPVNIRRMNKQIQEYQAIALEAGRTSPLGKRAIAEAAQLKDRYNDITAEVNRLANDGVKLQAALDLGTSITAGYTAFQGALALSGVESEKLQETLIKLQAAQSLLIGVETIRKNLEKESTLVLVAKSAAEKVATASTAAYTFVTSGATAVTKLLRLALLSLPFVAVGTAIAALIAYWDDFIGVVKDGLKWLGLYDDSEEKAAAERKKRLKEERRLREQRIKQIETNAKREQAIHNNRIANMDNEIKLLEAQGKTTTELQRKKLQEEINFTKAQNVLTLERISLKRQEIEQELQTLKKVRFFREESLNKNKAALNELKTESENSAQAIANAENQLAVFEANLITERKEKNKEYYESKEDERQKDLEQERKHLQNLQKLQDDFLNELEAETDKFNEQFLTNQEIEEKAVEAKYFRLLALAEQYGEDTKVIEANREAELTEIRNKFAKEDIENSRMLRQMEAEMIADEIEQEKVLKEEQAIIDFENKLLKLEEEGLLTNELKINLENQLQDELTRINQQAELQRFQNGLEWATKSANALQSLGDAVFAHKMKNVEKGSKEEERIAKKQFKFNKALQLGMAVIDTSKAIISSLAQSPVAIGPIPNPVGIASLALATITGAAQIATIAAQQFQGSGGSAKAPSAPNVGSGAGAAAPQIAPVTNTSTLVPQEQEPTQVFVTETDITNTQNQVAVIETQATIK